MRSLSLWRAQYTSLVEAEFSSSGETESHITAVAEDLDQNALLLTTERGNSTGDGEAHIEIWSISNGDTLVSRFVVSESRS